MRLLRSLGAAVGALFAPHPTDLSNVTFSGAPRPTARRPRRFGRAASGFREWLAQTGRAYIGGKRARHAARLHWREQRRIVRRALVERRVIW